MNLCRCANGHFYDKEKYATCPHCANGAGANDGRTYAFDQTEPVNMGPAYNAEPTVPQATPLPISGMNANDFTVPGMGDYEDQPTVPLQGAGDDIFSSEIPTTPIAAPPVSEDDDHTIGFFDDDFFSNPTKSTTPVVQPVKKTPKLSSPCVGWLIAIGGKHIGTDFRLKAGKNYVGRNESNDIVLAEDMSVSREKHATVVYEPKNHLYFVQPGESSSLVYRNDEIVLTPILLNAYDIITVGEVNLLFVPLCGKEFNWSALFEKKRAESK